MKKSFVFALAMVAACSGAHSPIAPTAQAEERTAHSAYLPQHDNIPATFKGQESGPIIYLCATQLRAYAKDGTTRLEEDHYLQYEPCPATPIE